MTFERQKKFPFISSKFQTPADKVIKVSAGTEGAQYLGRRRGRGGVLGRLLSAFYQIPPHQPGPVNYRLGGIYASHYQTLWGILIGVRLCLSFSNVPLHSPNLFSSVFSRMFVSVFVSVFVSISLLVHCCTLSLCYLGAETGYRVGTPWWGPKRIRGW